MPTLLPPGAAVGTGSSIDRHGSANAAEGALAFQGRPVYWACVIGLVLLILGSAEIFLRSNLLWRLPVEYLLQHRSDRETRTTWLVHNPPPPGEDEILVVGSSTAGALIEPASAETQRILQEALGRPRLHLIALTDSGGCYAEHLTVLENALEQGHRPAIVALISFPTCLRDHDYTSALLATRVPLVSSTLATLDDRSRSLDMRIRAGLVRASAVHRYRHPINAWVRERWKGLLLGQAPWEPIAWAGDNRVESWEGSFELDYGRYERLLRLPGNLSPAGTSARHLGAILDLAGRHGARTIVIESPWAPPFFDVLARDADLYYRAMGSIAAQHGALYVDPNRDLRLPQESFEDLFHVNRDGARAYMPLVVSALSRTGPSDAALSGEPGGRSS